MYGQNGTGSILANCLKGEVKWPWIHSGSMFFTDILHKLVIFDASVLKNKKKKESYCLITYVISGFFSSWDMAACTVPESHSLHFHAARLQGREEESKQKQNKKKYNARMKHSQDPFCQTKGKVKT